MANYGEGAATYNAVGGEKGLTALVNDFYKIMHESPDYKKIRDMHPKDLDVTTDKLLVFLTGWMGGKSEYSKKYGPMSIPGAHSHLAIDELERDMWLSCMTEALIKQNYPEDLIEYLIIQLGRPAERIREVSVMMREKKQK
ncbi:hypothetical protein GCM10009133_01760 [Cocleimonas flava]|uniref:Hemoglobin n=1 Tax=Cocleimonas flava TaxID=634765 RepID=A0A4R1EWJ1_9GAMM|nr:group II truncated hemoglobin [Cocleimonas flava]TCJ85150.1 hemoglobin [Cocleimonas flava]